MTSIKVSHTFFPASPGALTQAIRNFAKSLESWLTNAMMNIPEEMVRIKVGLLFSFCGWNHGFSEPICFLGLQDQSLGHWRLLLRQIASLQTTG